MLGEDGVVRHGPRADVARAVAGHALRLEQRRDVAGVGDRGYRLDSERLAVGLHGLDHDRLLSGELLQGLGEVGLLDHAGGRLAAVGDRPLVEDFERLVVDGDRLQRDAGFVRARHQLGDVVQDGHADPGSGGGGGERGARVLRVDEPEEHVLRTELLLQRLQRGPRVGEMLVVGEDEHDGLGIVLAEELVLHAAMVVQREVVERQQRRLGHALDAVEAASLRQRRCLEPLMPGRARRQLHQVLPDARGVQVVGAEHLVGLAGDGAAQSELGQPADGVDRGRERLREQDAGCRRRAEERCGGPHGAGRTDRERDGVHVWIGGADRLRA